MREAVMELVALSDLSLVGVFKADSDRRVGHSQRLRCSISHRQAGSINARADTVLLVEKLTQGARQSLRELLPREQLAPDAQIQWANRRKYFEPSIGQINAASVCDQTEAGIVRMGCQHIAQQLVAAVLPSRVVKLAQAEDLTEIRVALHALHRAAFE